MRGTAGEPGDALAPAAQRGRSETPSSSPDTDASGHGPTSDPEQDREAEQPASQTQGAGAPVNAAAPRSTGTPKPSERKPSAEASAAAGGTGTASAAEPSSEPAAAAAASGGSPEAATAVASPGGGAGTHTDEEPPGNRPKKPMLAAAAIVGAVLISVPFLVAGQDDDRKPEKDQTQNAAGTVLDAQRVPAPETYTSESPKPSVKPSKKETVKPSVPPVPKPVVVPPSPSPSASKPAEKKPEKKAATGPPAGTAAAALAGLAKSDPQGRHICYRAFVSGQGWQSAVCDGTMTGTSGQGKKITALNIAVWNVEGSSANALLHEGGSSSAKWAPSWTAVVGDSKNNYIGSSKPGAPFLTGFAMNVGKGNVCHTAKMQNGGWGQQFCKNGRPEYMFVGTTDNNNWFEAVKLTV